MNKASKLFLEAYLRNASPTGHEANGQRLWLDYLKGDYESHFSDTYGSVAAIVHPKADYKVVIEAHADEISWMVNYISEEGLIYVIKNGGTDHQIAPAKRVHIHTDEGRVKGVFGWPAIHIRDPKKETAVSLKDLFIDIGASSKKEVEKLGVKVGQVISYEESPFVMQQYWGGRGLDNRMGGFIIAEAFKRIAQQKEKIAYGLYAVNSVQEEIGLYGAQMISRRIKPDIALIVDVCHDTSTPMYAKKEQGAQFCGKGAVITYGASVHRKLAEDLEKTAQAHKIPYQRMAAGRYTGTDTDAFAYSDIGVASALISLPLKYMHTTVELAHEADIEQSIRLITAFALSLEKGKKYRYL